MGLWTRIREWLSEPAFSGDGHYGAPQFNPMTGLPMIGGLDAGGNAWGTGPQPHFDAGCHMPSHEFSYTPASASQIYVPISTCDPNRGW